MTTLGAVLVAVFSVGGAGVIATIFKGINGWRAGAARTEARAIQNLERYRDEADWRAQAVGHERDYAYELVAYWRNRAGDAEFKIRHEWGPENLPAVGTVPVFQPLTRTAVQKVVIDNGRTDTS